KAGTKWMNIFPLIQDDPRYVAMLGQPGSSPLDLFWDTVEDEERALRGPRNDVLDVLDVRSSLTPFHDDIFLIIASFFQDKRYEITLKTTFDEFNAVMVADRRTANIDPDNLQLIFERIQEKVQRRTEDEKHAADRHQRRAV